MKVPSAFHSIPLNNKFFHTFLDVGHVVTSYNQCCAMLLKKFKKNKKKPSNPIFDSFKKIGDSLGVSLRPILLILKPCNFNFEFFFKFNKKKKPPCLLSSKPC
jgi:hypothetical protein